AAKLLRLTAADLAEFGIVDEVIPEPLGGAHRDPEKVAAAMKEAIVRHLSALDGLSKDELLSARHEKYRKIGAYTVRTEDELVRLEEARAEAEAPGEEEVHTD